SISLPSGSLSPALIVIAFSCVGSCGGKRSYRSIISQMPSDLLIKNGTVVDGTGAPSRRADLPVKDGKVVEVGKVSGSASKVIEADGLVVAPGFIDPHTHYDAQICWDGAVTPSSWHGVTSVMMGNCGVGIAPCKPETREVAMRDLVNVEAIPFE